MASRFGGLNGSLIAYAANGVLKKQRTASHDFLINLKTIFFSVKFRGSESVRVERRTKFATDISQKQTGGKRRRGRKLVVP